MDTRIKDASISGRAADRESKMSDRTHNQSRLTNLCGVKEAAGNFECQSAHDLADDCRRPIDGISFPALHAAVAGASFELSKRQWKDWWRMINTIYKPKDSRIWRWKYRQQPADVKIEDVSLRTSDKQVAEKRRAEMLRERQHERDGIIPPKSIRDGRNAIYWNIWKNFLGDLRRRGNSDKHLSNLEARINRLIAECPWNTVKAVTSDSFQTWRRGKSELSPKTVNDYLDAARCLFNWLIKNNQTLVNPLVSVEKVKTEGRQTRVRRSFTVDEVKRLVAVAGEFKAVYLMAPHTGLRRSELSQLKWADLHLEEEKPFAIVRASTTKNSKVAPMALHPELLPLCVRSKMKAS